MESKLLLAIIDAKSAEINCLARHFNLDAIYTMNIIHTKCMNYTPDKELLCNTIKSFEIQTEEILENTEILDVPWIFHQRLSEFESLIKTFYFQL